MSTFTLYIFMYYRRIKLAVLYEKPRYVPFISRPSSMVRPSGFGRTNILAKNEFKKKEEKNNTHRWLAIRHLTGPLCNGRQHTNMTRRNNWTLLIDQVYVRVLLIRYTFTKHLFEAHKRPGNGYLTICIAVHDDIYFVHSKQWQN
jgi:hypothetical protein